MHDGQKPRKRRLWWRLFICVCARAHTNKAPWTARSPALEGTWPLARINFLIQFIWLLGIGIKQSFSIGWESLPVNKSQPIFFLWIWFFCIGNEKSRSYPEKKLTAGCNGHNHQKKKKKKTVAGQRSMEMLGEKGNAHSPNYSTLKSSGIFSSKRFKLECSPLKKSIPAWNVWKKIFQNFSVCCSKANGHWPCDLKFFPGIFCHMAHHGQQYATFGWVWGW